MSSLAQKPRKLILQAISLGSLRRKAVKNLEEIKNSGIEAINKRAI